MPRFFNTAGPCNPQDHYMLPPEGRLPDLRTWIERKLYFTLHAPRQAGKTTAVHALALALVEEGRHAALLTSCEVGQQLSSNLSDSIDAVLANLHNQAEIYLPAELRPPEPDPKAPAQTRLRDLLQRWARSCPRPLVLFFDEIDALYDDALLSVLQQLRAGYQGRPEAFPQSVGLIGLRDVRDYRLPSRQEAPRLGTASPFNIKVRSFTLPDFTPEEVHELLDQHRRETGQVFTEEAIEHIYHLTRGQPWLTNALAQQLTWEEVPDPEQPIERQDVDRAREVLVLRRDTHLDSLVERLRERRVQAVLEPLLTGDLIDPGLPEDDLRYVEDLGLVRVGPSSLEVANPIYREIIPRALAQGVQDALPLERLPFVTEDGSLDRQRILEDFTAFWRQHSEFYLARSPYSEAAAQLIFMAFLHKIVNGGGSVEREYGVGRGRIDLCIRWPGDAPWALELKVWRDHRPDPLAEGLEQLNHYLERLGLDRGTLVLFDARAKGDEGPQKGHDLETYEDREIEVLRL